MHKSEKPKVSAGKLGELSVELRLVSLGWHTVRLDTAQMASNADLLAIKNLQRVAIQVKTTDARVPHSHDKHVFLGYGNEALLTGGTVFNSKPGPLTTDVVIAVLYNEPVCRFVVLPVAAAENIARQHFNFWQQKLKKTGERRKSAFPLYVPFLKSRERHAAHDDCMIKSLALFEDRWSVLDEEVDALRRSENWPLPT
jgi:hypothetical protein